MPGHCKAYCVFHDDETAGNGQVNLPLALTKSSDFYFYNLGYLFWSQRGRYGETPIQDVAHRYGLDEYTNVDLPNEVVGRVDSLAVRRVLHAEAPNAFPHVTWFTGDNIEMAFGQGTTALTPIAMANAYATFANGGHALHPEVAAAVLDPHGKVVERYLPRVAGHVQPAGADPRPDPRRARGRGRQPLGHRLLRVPGLLPPLAGQLPDRRQDRDRVQRPRASSPTRGSSGSAPRPTRSTSCSA